MVMAASADVNWVRALVSRFSKPSNPLFPSLHTSTSFTEHLVVCESGRVRGSSDLLVVTVTEFVFKMSKNYLR